MGIQVNWYYSSSRGLHLGRCPMLRSKRERERERRGDPRREGTSEEWVQTNIRSRSDVLSILGSVASCNSFRCKSITIRWLLLGRDCKRKRYKRKTIRDSDKIFQNYAQYSNEKDNNYIVGVVNFGDAQLENFINFFHFERENANVQLRLQKMVSRIFQIPCWMILKKTIFWYL